MVAVNDNADEFCLYNRIKVLRLFNDEAFNASIS